MVSYQRTYIFLDFGLKRPNEDHTPTFEHLDKGQKCVKHQLTRTNKHFRDVLDAIGLDEDFDEAFSMMKGCDK